MSEAIQVFSTVEKREDAVALTRAAVEGRLAACAQIVGPVASTYWWRGKIETAEEWLCIFKSRLDLYPALEAALRAAHPYENPEILAAPVVAGSRPYLEWLAQETAGAGTPAPEGG